MVLKSDIDKIRYIKEGLYQKQNIDMYDCGLYNGIEMILSILEKRDPSYIMMDKEPLVLEEPKEEQKSGRTMIKELVKNG